MRFLGVGTYDDLAAMYHGMAARGHEVKVFGADPACHDVFGGMALFESAVEGQAQDELRRGGFQVIGGSGLLTARSYSFTSYADAIGFLQRTGGRYVLKFNGADSPRTRNYIGELDDGADMMALLTMYRDHSPPGSQPDFVLMAHLRGVEVGVGAYFNGEAFLDTACIDFEHKRFFSGDLGELTGEMGTIVSYRGAQRLFDATLGPLADLLRQGAYCGYINVNLIVHESGLWPLEFTSRFGKPGFVTCEALHTEPWEEIFARMLRRDSLALPTRSGCGACGTAFSTPPGLCRAVQKRTCLF